MNPVLLVAPAAVAVAIVCFAAAGFYFVVVRGVGLRPPRPRPTGCLPLPPDPAAEQRRIEEQTRRIERDLGPAMPPQRGVGW